MGNKSTIVVAAIISIGVVIIVGGCIGPMYWDGYTSRQVVVTVFDENTNDPIPNAAITLEQRHHSTLSKNLSKESTLNATTGPDGIGKLYVHFPASGKDTLFMLMREGNFGIRGTLEVTAKEYSTLTEPLSSLVGKNSFPIGNKSAIHVRVNLIKTD